MLDGFKFLLGFSSDAACGRIRALVLGIFFFQRFQLFEKPVVFGVGDNRLVFLVIKIVVLIQLPEKLANARLRGLFFFFHKHHP